MKFLKLIVAFTIPALFLFIIWRMINLGDGYTYRGLKYAYEYMKTYPGFTATYEVITNLGKFFTWGWGDVVGAVLAPGYLTLKIIFSCAYLTFGLVNDFIRQIIWFFSWIFNMVA